MCYGPPDNPEGKSDFICINVFNQGGNDHDYATMEACVAALRAS